jgi:hypothetical protein
MNECEDQSHLGQQRAVLNEARPIDAPPSQSTRADAPHALNHSATDPTLARQAQSTPSLTEGLVAEGISDRPAAVIPPPVSLEAINQALGEPTDQLRSYDDTHIVRREHGARGARIGGDQANYRFELKSVGGEIYFKVEISNRGVGANGTKNPDGRSVMYQDYLDMREKLRLMEGADSSMTGGFNVVRDYVVNPNMVEGISQYKTSAGIGVSDSFVVLASDVSEVAQVFMRDMTSQRGTNGSMTQNFMNTINHENAGNFQLHSIEVSYPNGSAAGPSMIYRYRDPSNPGSSE